jgi:hypothetical protein
MLLRFMLFLMTIVHIHKINECKFTSSQSCCLFNFVGTSTLLLLLMRQNASISSKLDEVKKELVEIRSQRQGTTNAHRTTLGMPLSTESEYKDFCDRIASDSAFKNDVVSFVCAVNISVLISLLCLTFLDIRSSTGRWNFSERSSSAYDNAVVGY